ncbi:MAG: hypothetical protein AUG06_11845 [Actinobacteria bacterium 13_1_20CM_2_65_11]|nr:MAG: hypothetical protein AUI42_11340 [Actinobacteria bacterium 13_1_40CM_2_65_8]OLE78077.1 MAG: hypothetical protein AUG06_11845 [Actinobacteria bacterium 13_1_20CM_2_65_11]
MSLSSRRLAATLVALVGGLIVSAGALAGTLPDSTWVGLPALPQQKQSPLFALAVDPTNDQALISGNVQGSLLRSTNGGSTWTSVHAGRAAITTIVFDPFTPGRVLAGTRGSGVLISKDGGATWTDVTGLGGRDVRVIGFALTLVAAGTDNGVYVSADGTAWKQSGLPSTSIDALAVAAVHVPIHLVAGSDTASSAAGPPLYDSVDGGATWTSVTPALSGTVVSRLVAGPLPPTGNVRPLVAGTNAGLFISADNGSTFSALSGGELLPSTDYTQVAFVTDHHDRFYVASDGGGSRSGGLWWTHDKGQHFSSLVPPIQSITALAVSNTEAPTLYVATFRASDHSSALWAYHDTGAPPQGPFSAVTPTASGSRPGKPTQGGLFDFVRLVSSSQAPYIALGAVALLVLLLAAISHFRGSRR